MAAAKRATAKARSKAGAKRKTRAKTAPRPSPEPAAAPAAKPNAPRYQTVPDPVALAANLFRLATEFQGLVFNQLRRARGMQSGREVAGSLAATARSFAPLLRHLIRNPAAVIASQAVLAQSYLAIWQRTAARAFLPGADPGGSSADKRFRDEAWQDSLIHALIREMYEATASWAMEQVESADDLGEKERAVARFYVQQLMDAIAPSNFILTNPEVLRETLATNAGNLVQGLGNLAADLERGDGKLVISQTDMDAFEVGGNIALTPGKVIYRNDLMELLQYEPATEKVYRRPLLIFPPWINKFYILDLRPENSFIRWATEQGYTVFVVSWVNPDETLAQKTFEDYMREGIFEALDAVEAATGERQVNAIGYCIGGTLLTAALGYMAQEGDDGVAAATFFAAQADFTEAGDLRVFIDEPQLDALEKRMEASGGVLEAQSMASTFNALRSRDLVWNYVVNNYLMGRPPRPFDLLYWNADATRMPQAMHLFYLRECYLKNHLATGELELGGRRIDLSQVKIPIYLQSSQTDHIAPARSIYKSTRLFGGPVTFMMAGSGHIAGVINPPAAGKYQHWLNPDLPPTLEEWQAGATEYPGSWWPSWEKDWLRPKSGPRVPARTPGGGKLKPLGDAPGEYVKMKAV